jgi:hypothetical protein
VLALGLSALVALCAPGGCRESTDALLLDGGRDPAAAEPGDLDGDGHPDLVVADQSAGGLLLFRGDGTGGLARTGTAPAGPNPVDVAVADLDEDGDPDLAVANHEERFVTILLGTGDGTFRPAEGSPLPIPARPHPHAVAAADLDGDGHVDLLVDDREAEAVLVLPGRGDGTFEEPVRIPIGGDPYRGMALGDLNGDGRLDLVTPNPREVAVRLAEPAGEDGRRFGFRAAPPVPAPTPFVVGLGDLDGDGHLDLVTAPEQQAEARLYLGDGAGGFAEHPESPFPAGRGGKKVATGDFDGDGVGDAAVSGWFSPDVVVLFGSQRDSESAIRTTTVHGGVNPWALTAVDLDGDGRDELVVGDAEEGAVRVYSERLRRD